MKSIVQSLFVAVALAGCCGGGSATVADPIVTPPAVPPVPAASGTSLTLGAPAVPLAVPAAPTFTFSITAPGEYQVDVMGPSPADAQLALYQNGSLLLSDSDSGDDLNARVIAFLTPGPYEVRATEWRHRAYTASASLTPLPPLTPAAAMAPGAPPVLVNAPAGESDRGASAEITLTIATAGNYRIDASSPSFDAQLLVHQNGAEVGRDADSGENNDAQLTSIALTPGVYSIRVYDWMHRAAPITVTVVPAA